MQKLQNDHGCKSLRLIISVLVRADGFGSFLSISEFSWKYGRVVIKVEVTDT